MKPRLKKRYAVIRWLGRITRRHVSGAYCWCVRETEEGSAT